MEAFGTSDFFKSKSIFQIMVRCENMVLSVHWEVVFANVGSVVNPQPKVIGVKCRFGAPRDLVSLYRNI